MSSKKMKAAFFDIDGTLCGTDRNGILAETRKELIQLKRQGVKLILATGRQWWAMPQTDIAFDGFMTANGSFCMTGDGDIIEEVFLPSEEVRALIDESLKENFICYLSTGKRKPFSLFVQDESLFRDHPDFHVSPVTEIDSLLNEGVLQAIVYQKLEDVEAVLEKAMPSCYACNWTSRFFDINKKGVSKLSGMKRFLEHYQIDVSETIAFGDGNNDIPMLQYAGIGVAMGNASTIVKDCADYVTDTADNDGIAKALRTLGLIE